ncbi:hypothetical protein CSUNSWCD_453 [Campylobacter showae CSUNSWCD]|uniref:Uncharacterized protein n=1 Tax=Campylobacter showae CSUNSWCD TaxID=1244083 RepID=M5ITB3_9BACT|nr:hypothetical protein CSUNSWCD_453 [Campylobacter showae CSUNSWCD]
MYFVILLASYAKGEILSRFIVGKRAQASNTCELEPNTAFKFAVLGAKPKTATKFSPPLKSKISHQCHFACA